MYFASHLLFLTEVTRLGMRLTPVLGLLGLTKKLRVLFSRKYLKVVIRSGWYGVLSFLNNSQNNTAEGDLKSCADQI